MRRLAPHGEGRRDRAVLEAAARARQLLTRSAAVGEGRESGRRAADAAALMDYPLTVDSTFKTCDDSIYAAGRHVAGQERFNSLELGALIVDGWEPAADGTKAAETRQMYTQPSEDPART